MAKKRKKDKQEAEEYEFTPPEFNEKEFLKKELTDLKVGLITVVFAIALGVAAAAITLANDDLVIVAFFVGIAGIATLKQFYAIIGIDTSEFKKKNWAGNIASFFFTFLAIWVLLMNVPFTDHASPDVEEVIVWVTDGTHTYGIRYDYVASTGVYEWVSTDPTNYSATIPSAGAYTVNITAKVTDNGKLSKVEISGVSSTVLVSQMVDLGEHRFGFSVLASQLDSSLNFYIVATDAEGNSVTMHPDNSIPVG